MSQDKNSDSKELSNDDYSYENSDNQTDDKDHETNNKVRELLLFQLKLFADAARDLILSPVSIVFFIMDLAGDKKKEDTHFERLMAFGRRTDHHINLFKHRRSYKKGMMTVDDAAKIVEDTLVNEMKTGELSEKSFGVVKDAFTKAFSAKKNDKDKS